ncbi:MAG: disulfide bond formation protein B [Proteobacteria bacterium]|nr:disulfide bond formation protein B [Pseudomonadota bacterium]
MYCQFWILSLGALTALVIAFVAEYMFLIRPCPLCWYERYVYMALLAVSVLGIISQRVMFLICSLILLGTGIIITFYHFGVENHWWQFMCQDVGHEAQTVEELKRLMMQTPPPSCNTPLWTIFGISAVFWSLMYQLFLFVLVLLPFFKKKIKP